MGYLGIFIIIVSVLAIFRKRQTRNQESVEQKFWERENQANHTRRQDISGLSYLTIPLDKFPIGICKDEDLQECENTLTVLSAKKILNLGSLSNTDLKLKYGLANLDTLTDYEQNFTTLCQTLVAYANRLIQLNYKKEAKSVLEFGLSCGSDLSRNYLLLADLYVESGDFDSLAALTKKASEIDSPMKASILTHLKEKEALLS